MQAERGFQVILLLTEVENTTSLGFGVWSLGLFGLNNINKFQQHQTPNSKHQTCLSLHHESGRFYLHQERNSV
jgi:hypothetical protein